MHIELANYLRVTLAVYMCIFHIMCWGYMFQISNKSELRTRLQALVTTNLPDLSTAVVDDINSIDDSGRFCLWPLGFVFGWHAFCCNIIHILPIHNRSRTQPQVISLWLAASFCVMGQLLQCIWRWEMHAVRHTEEIETHLLLPVDHCLRSQSVVAVATVAGT